MTTTKSGRDERAEALATAAERERFEAWAGELAARGRRPKTIDSYRSDWLGLAGWWHGRTGRAFDATGLDGSVARAFKAHLAQSGMSAATINRKLVFLKRYADWLRGRGVISRAARDGVRAVGAVVQAPRRPRTLSDIEVRRFLRVVDERAGVRDQAIIYTLLETGLRVSELVALDREQVALGPRSGFIRLDDDRGRRRRERRIPLSASARKRLRAYLDERGDHDGRLFEGERGPLTANGVQRMMRKYCAFAQVRVSPQTLRHTFAASYLVDHRGDLVGLAELLGHETLETTRLYLEAEAARRGGSGREEDRGTVVLGRAG